MGSPIRDNGFFDTAGSRETDSGGAQPLHTRGAGIAEACRTGFRLLIISVSLAEIAARYALLWLHGSPNPAARAKWLHASCRRLVRRLGISVVCRGTRPAQGLVCSNHLSYLDILIYASVLPCAFVSKSEVRRWPVFGFLARRGGTIFVDRRSRTSADKASQEIARTLKAGVPVLLFPEGTSTDGASVLRFHAPLFEAAVRGQLVVTPAAIAYRAGTLPERELCWFGNAAFVPHLLRTLSWSHMHAELDFHPDRQVYPDRKTAAFSLHETVTEQRRRMMRSVGNAGSALPWESS